jgi:tetratricopeptide (TPR) repeat protein
LRSVEDLSYTLELPPLSSDEGIEFLLHRAKVVDPLASRTPLPPELAEPAQALVEAVGGLPLAIDQAGAYIERTGCGLRDYLHLFQQHQISLLGERSEMAHHPTSVVNTFQLSFERMEQGNETAASLLRICAFLAPDAIPEELFTRGASSLGSVLCAMSRDAYRFNQTLEEALRYSLLDRQQQNRTLSMHRLVQAVLRDMLSEGERHMWAERAVLAVDAAFPDVEHCTWLQCERLLPHALVCATWIEREPILTTEASHLLHKAGTYLEERGQYSEAEPLLMRALAICEQQWGTEHLLTASSLNNLARLYRHLGRYSEAEPFFRRALSIREQQLGAEHPDTASSLYNLAALYSYQGRYSEAEPLFQRALAVFEKQLGTEHPLTATSLNGLARTYCDRGKYCEAESLFQRALAIQELHLGVEHPETARSLNNLGELYYNQGKYSEAEPLYQRALLIYERQLGTEHPFTATSLNGLARTYRNRGKYCEAESLFQRALAIREQQLGAVHPDTANSLHGLAELYQHQGVYEQAEAFYRRALAIREQHLGTEHPSTADSLYRLAELQQCQGKYHEAEMLCKRALTIQEQRLGTTHPKTQKTRSAYLGLLCRIRRDAKTTVLDTNHEPVS